VLRASAAANMDNFADLGIDIVSVFAYEDTWSRFDWVCFILHNKGQVHFSVEYIKAIVWRIKQHEV
jgi:hypothetical protein